MHVTAKVTARPSDQDGFGQVVLINGASSAGKTAVASALLSLLDQAWFLMSVDDINAMRHRRDIEGSELDDVLRRTRAGFHRAVAGMAAAGNNIVVDHVLSEPWRLDDCLDVFEGLDVVFVGVRCDAVELERRERVRRDRPPGLALAQLSEVHVHSDYDVEIYTTNNSAAQGAERIAAFLARSGSGRAFDRLRSRRGAALVDPDGSS
ncbi:MAG: AAA family ATPase [Propionibacteriales bacterium]|nr:AAA family ATPase [Propionibacteriales bacterium]